MLALLVEEGWRPIGFLPLWTSLAQMEVIEGQASLEKSQYPMTLYFLLATRELLALDPLPY